MVRLSRASTPPINQNKGMIKSMRVEDMRDKETAPLEREERDKRQLLQSQPQHQPEVRTL